MTNEFLEANTAISKFVTFILMLLLFIILFQLGSGLLQYMFGPNYNPYLIDGMVVSNIQTIISADPNLKLGSRPQVPIYRSIDAPQGIEYTWNVWFVINNVTGIENSLIFSKGRNSAPSSTDTQNGLVTTIENSGKYVGVSPGLFLEHDAAHNVNTLIECFAIIVVLC